MKSLGSARTAFIISVTAALLGCGGSQPPIGAPDVATRDSALALESDSTHYKIVYSFAGGSDGATPYAGLIYMDGTFYGTTELGGTTCSRTSSNGCGTVYSVTSDGAEKVLHDFSGGGDGRTPLAGLIAVGSTLYGTTEYGGNNPECFSGYSGYIPKCGTVFSVTQSGTEKVLYSFAGDPNDGAYPYAGLVGVNGTLYGTTYIGGNDPECSLEEYPFACGVVFSITTAGAEKVLHNFDGNPDGAYPWAGLIQVKGTLYGTTAYGGKHKFGTVFSITTAGALKILHSFGAGSDGRMPHAGLIDVKGTLYGTTSGGGAFSCGTGETCGTVFSITPSGKEKVLHSFRNRADGVQPAAPLVELNDNLYGTTVFGSRNKCGGYGCGDGTVFSITRGGSEKVLHYFGAQGDGAHPQAGLINVNGTLYGTTAEGGAYSYYGTVFSLKP
jgi:uncharacterized repeat protein (TIGR03803 family)